MRLQKMANMPEYTSGCFDVYDITDRDGMRVIQKRALAPVWFRDIGVYDRTRVTFEQADMEVTRKIRIPKWDGISSNCVCMIGTEQHKVYNKTDVISAQGFPETELTLINPAMDYEIYEEGEDDEDD